MSFLSDEISMWDDYKADYYFARDYPFGVPCDEWTKRDGTKIKISDMTDAHIKNCMRIVGEDDPWYWQFQNELRRRRNEIH